MIAAVALLVVAVGLVLLAWLVPALARRRHADAFPGPPPAVRPGFVQRLRERIDPPVEPGPDDWVVAADVPFSDGPMLHSAIEGAGIPAVLQWVRPPLPAHGFDRYRIVVRQRDLAEAEQIRDDLRRPGPPPDPFDA